MKKAIAFLTALSMGLVLLTGCGSTANTNTANTSAAAETAGSAGNTSGDAAASDSGASAAAGIRPTDVTLYGGTVGGSWNLCTTVISNFLPNDIPDIRTTSSPGTGLGNIAAVQNGQATIAFSQITTTFDGIKGLEPFTEPQDKIVNLAYIYVEPLHVIVRADSDIQSIADLKGKTIGTFAPGNSAELVCRQLLSLHDMTYDDVKTSFGSASDLAEQFKDGLIDAIIYATALPASTVTDITTSKDIRLLNITDEELEGMQTLNDAFFPTVIPAGTYPGVNEDTNTIGAYQHLICSSELDEEFVYEVTKSLVKNIDQIKDAHVAFSALTPELMATDVGIPFHPGAERYYREAGLLK